MSLRPCAACQQRPAGKLSSVYWSWSRADRTRAAVLQRLCIACFIIRVMPFFEVEPSETILCPSCHAPSDDDMDPVFAKVYVPGQPEQELELATCPTCAVQVRSEAMAGAQLLADRNPEFGGQAPKLDATSVWDSLGFRR
jgi:hypothetical protein